MKENMNLFSNARSGALALATLLACVPVQAQSQAFLESSQSFARTLNDRARVVQGDTCFGRQTKHGESVVLIITRDAQGNALTSGSGSIVMGRDGQKRILTARHVVQDTQETPLIYDSRGRRLGNLERPNGERRIQRAGGEDAHLDVIALRITPQNPEQAERLSRAPALPVNISPENTKTLFGWSGNRGVPAVHRGMSGGPVLNRMGQVVGVVHAVVHGLSPEALAQARLYSINAALGIEEEGFSRSQVTLLRRAVMMAAPLMPETVGEELGNTVSQHWGHEPISISAVGYSNGATCTASTGFLGAGLDPFSSLALSRVPNTRAPRTPEGLLEAIPTAGFLPTPNR